MSCVVFESGRLQMDSPELARRPEASSPVILGLAAGAGDAAKHLARVACQDAKSRPRDAHDAGGFSD